MFYNIILNAFNIVNWFKDGSGADVSADKSHLANKNPFRYRGYYYDVETGLYYLQSRYYDPVTCRFINEDSLLCTNNNMYAYNRKLTFSVKN